MTTASSVSPYIQLIVSVEPASMSLGCKMFMSVMISIYLLIAIGIIIVPIVIPELSLGILGCIMMSATWLVVIGMMIWVTIIVYENARARSRLVRV